MCADCVQPSPAQDKAPRIRAGQNHSRSMSLSSVILGAATVPTARTCCRLLAGLLQVVDYVIGLPPDQPDAPDGALHLQLHGEGLRVAHKEDIMMRADCDGQKTGKHLSNCNRVTEKAIVGAGGSACKQ